MTHICHYKFLTDISNAFRFVLKLNFLSSLCWSQLRVEDHFGFCTFWTKFCNILKYGMNLKFETIVKIFRKIMQLNAVIILKSTTEYNWKIISKCGRKMDLYPALYKDHFENIWYIILTWLRTSSQSDCRIAMFGWLTKDWVCLVGWPKPSRAWWGHWVNYKYYFKNVFIYIFLN